MTQINGPIEIKRVLSFRTRKKLRAYLFDKSIDHIHHPRDDQKINALFKAIRSGRIIIAETNTQSYFLIKQVAVDILDVLSLNAIHKLHRVAKKYEGRKEQPEDGLPYSITGSVEPGEKLRTAAVRCVRTLKFKSRVVVLESLQGESIIQSALRQRGHSKKLENACLLFRLAPEDIPVDPKDSLPWFPSFRRYFRYACIIPHRVRKNRTPNFEVEEQAEAHRDKRIVTHEWALEKNDHTRYSFLSSVE